jgi:hypothetical protein
MEMTLGEECLITFHIKFITDIPPHTDNFISLYEIGIIIAFFQF